MLKKVRVFDLQVGMFIVDTGLSWLDHPYLYGTEGPLESEDQVRAIRAEGYAEAFIETDKDLQGHDSLRLYDRDAVSKALAESLVDQACQGRGNKNVSLADEMPQAAQVHNRAVAAMRQVMEDVAKGQAIQGQPCLDAGREVAASVSRNRDALVCLHLLSEEGDSYHIRHGVGVAVLAAAFGDSLGLTRNQVSELTVAGLLHDVGKAFNPDELLNKPGTLDPNEYNRLKRHPIESCSVVSGCMNLSGNVLRGIAEHHERHDGSGYPRGLKGSEQSFFGRILAIADMFDALTQDRPYKERILPDKAMSAMYALRGRDFEPGLLERFIKCLGVYPVGCLVRLSTGEHALVSQSNPDTPLRPKVTVVFDQDMAPIHPVFLDLSGREGPAPARATEITGVVDHRPHGVQASALLA
jgi:HD-GYP domain-containing protein (c-di-GMP phosphodiesterase class II)